MSCVPSERFARKRFDGLRSRCTIPRDARARAPRAPAACSRRRASVAARPRASAIWQRSAPSSSSITMNGRPSAPVSTSTTRATCSAGASRTPAPRAGAATAPRDPRCPDRGASRRRAGRAARGAPRRRRPCRPRRGSARPGTCRRADRRPSAALPRLRARALSSAGIGRAWPPYSLKRSPPLGCGPRTKAREDRCNLWGLHEGTVSAPPVAVPAHRNLHSLRALQRPIRVRRPGTCRERLQPGGHEDREIANDLGGAGGRAVGTAVARERIRSARATPTTRNDHHGLRHRT